MKIEFEEGFYPELSMEMYHAHKDSYSRSTIVEFNKSPAYCKAYKERTDEKKRDVFELGTAGHSAILEGLPAYMDRVAVVPEHVLGKNGARSTKAYKQWAEDNKDKTLLLEKQVDQVKGMYRAAMGRETFSRYLSDGQAEVSGFWYETDQESGHKILCKVRPDYLPGKQVVTDLKTTGLDIVRPDENVPSAWERHAYYSKYHWSAYLTCRGLTQLTGIKHDAYYFAIVHVDPPHDCALIEVSKKILDLAEEEMLPLFPRLIECDRTDTWPGSPDVVQIMKFPAWATRTIDSMAPF